MKDSNIYKILLTIILAFLLSACESLTKSDENGHSEASLSFKVADNTTLLKRANSHVAVDTAKILIKTIRFHSEMEGDSLDFKSESFILNLDMSGNLNTVAVEEIPDGSYHKVSFRIHKPGSDENIDDPDFVEGTNGSDRYSVVSKGVFNGEHFVFRSRKTTKQRVDLDPPLVIDATTSAVNVTLTVDVDRWFIDKDANELNPLDPDDESEIVDAIRRSFRGFEDNDLDGSAGGG